MPMTKNSDINKLADQSDIVKTKSNTENFSELSDKDFQIGNTQPKIIKVLAVIIGFILSFLLMAYWPFIFSMDKLIINISGFLYILMYIGGMIFFFFWIIGNKRNRYTPNWENYLIIPVLGTILCGYHIINQFASKDIEEIITPHACFFNSIICTIIFYYIKVIHLNTMSRVDDFFSKNSYTYFTTRVIEKHITTNKNAKYYRFTVINSKLQKQTLEINDYLSKNIENFYYNLKPEKTVVRLKIKQTLINHSEPLIKGFKIVEDSQDATNAEILQIIENKRIDQNMEKDQEIEEDNEMKWGCTFFITAGIEFLSSIIRKIGSVPDSYLEVFHKWNYAYIIIGIIIAAIWTLIPLIDSKKNGQKKKYVILSYRIPMDFSTVCILVFATGNLIIRIIGCFV